MKISKIIILFLGLVFFTMCNTITPKKEAETGTEDFIEEIDSLADIEYFMISPSEIFEYIFFEELKPDPSFVNPPSNARKYVTTNKMALNMGVYITDFIYLNLSSDKTQAINYYKVIQEIAPKLNIYSGTRDNIAERLQKNFANHDSVTEISKFIYYKILEDLELEGRRKLYSLMAGGVIIESIYLGAMNINDFNENQSLIEKVFEQREFLNNTYEFISATQTDNDIRSLLNKLEELKKCFGELETSDGKLIVSKNNNGHLKVEGGSKVVISAEGLDKLKEVASKVRNEIVSEK